MSQLELLQNFGRGLPYKQDVGGSSPSLPTSPLESASLPTPPVFFSVKRSADSAVALYREIPLTRGYIALVDPEDYEWLAQHKWCSLIGRHTVYAWRSIMVDGARKFLYMHRQILGEPPSLVDHWDTHGLHNWRDNLRAATRSQNCANARAKAPASGLKGVYLYGKGERYRAMIMVDGKTIHLGCRDAKEDAARLYDAAAIRYFGSFAKLNFPEVQPCAQ